MPENGTLTAEPKKRGRKPKNPDKEAIVAKLKNIARQNIGEFIRVPSNGALTNTQIYLKQSLDIDHPSNPTPEEVTDCIKEINYQMSATGHALPVITLHDPLEAIRLLKELGEI